MSKERLEEIKQYLVLLHNASDVDEETKDYIFKDLKVEWLIEQAERVEELENENRILKTVAESNKYIGEQYLEQNKRYREAILMALSDIDDHDFESVSKGLRKALEEAE